jgi:hypothetical protein
VQHGHPLVTAGAAQPTAMNEPFASVLRGIGADRRMSLADWAKPVAGIIISTALEWGSQRRLISWAMSMGQV